MHAAAEAPVLRPNVDAACAVCGAAARRVLATEAELAAGREYLRRFHRRRLRDQGEAALEERARFTHDYPTDIVRCTACGLLYRDPRPTAQEIARAYASDSYGEERLTALFQSQLEQFRPKARRLVRYIARSRPAVLEIGSFVGGFLAAAGELGCDAVGIDPGREVARFCEARGLRVLCEKAEDCSFPPESADCVAIWNTFDQLVDPHPTLSAARRCLRSGGVLAVRVPNGACFERSMRRLCSWPRPVSHAVRAAMAWNNLLTFPYLHGYSVATLDRLAGEYGFRRIAAEGDVLVRLADEETKRWAAWEESLLKGAWKLGLRASAFAGFDALGEAPWLDVLYEAPQR